MQAQAFKMMTMPGVLRFTVNGKWMHNETPVSHEGISLYFSKHLTFSSEHNCWVIEVDGKCVQVEIEDTPFIVTSISLSQIPIVAILNDDRKVLIDMSSFEVNEDNIWYCEDSDSNRHRISRSVANELLQLVEEDDCGLYVISINGRSFAIESKSNSHDGI